MTIEEASATDRLDLFGRAFGFTTRERELLSLLAIGSDTRALARQMSLSEHTSRTTSNRSSPRQDPVIASPSCHEPSAPNSAMPMTDP